MVILKTYSIDQCALYKVGSKNRLSQILGIGVSELINLASQPKYRVFELEEVTCPFTGKVTKSRWVQEPSGDLRRVHDRIRQLLSKIGPPGHAHAAIKGRSYRTNAAQHKLAAAVATFDIKSFYPNIPHRSVFEFFCFDLKCAPDIASLLTQIVVYPCDGGVHKGLPTGSPVSPILSVYASKKMFDSLAAIALRFNMKFTSYVDDLTFSGATIPSGLLRIVRGVVRHHGHELSEKKSRIFGLGQAKHVTGVVLRNGQLSVPFSRFRKARRIEEAIVKSSDNDERHSLRRKLAGLLGEAAYLDPRYQQWATRLNRDLQGSSKKLTSPTSPSTQ